MPDLPRFHLAFPVRDLAATRAFYLDILGCRLGRTAERWLDFDFHGHQITAHLDDSLDPAVATNAVEGRAVPVRHFGLILPVPAWQALAERLQQAGVAFLIEPHVRFPGEPGEQHTLFILDPAGNGLEFKAFADDAQVFAVQ